jgi:hypothetical protein
MTKRLWVWREVVPTDAPGDYYTKMNKLTTTGRAFVMRSADETDGPTEILGVFDSFEAAMKVVEIGNER